MSALTTSIIIRLQYSGMFVHRDGCLSSVSSCQEKIVFYCAGEYDKKWWVRDSL